MFTNQKGFTLIELIIVLAIASIIAAIAVPQFIEVQDKAKIKADQATIQMVEKAAELYVISENIDLPLDDLDAMELVNAKYIQSIPKSQENKQNTKILIDVDSEGKATAIYTSE